jgi:hypothetical protein
MNEPAQVGSLILVAGVEEKPHSTLFPATQKHFSSELFELCG